MQSYKKRIIELNKLICRICATEDTNSIPIFGDIGHKQDLPRKIKACLPVHIEEKDGMPKQICLACLTKLESFWKMHVSCKEAQIKIETKFSSLKNWEIEEQVHLPAVPVEERLRKLSNTYPVMLGESAVIYLTQEAPPAPSPVPLPTTVTREAQVLPVPQAGPVEPVLGPITYIAPAPATAAVPVPVPVPAATVSEEVYPQALIQVPQTPGDEQALVYQNSPAAAPAPVTAATPRRRAPLVTVPQPMASPAPPATAPAPQRPAPTPVKRKNADSTNGPDANNLCTYCNKYFTDNIIDHHVSLHLRKSFITCLECGKNFKTDEILQRHRCEEKKDKTEETIDLDADDDELIIL